MIKTNTKKITATLSIIVLILIGGLVFVNYYIENIALQTIELKKQNINNDNQYYPESLIDSKLQEAALVQNGFDQYYLDKNSLVVFIELLEDFALNNDTELRIENISVDDAPSNDQPISYGVLNAVISVRGSWVGVGQFLNNIENLPYAVQIKNTRLSRISDSSGWSLNLAIEILTN